MVVADGRILHNYSLQVNESSLTGESTNVEKSEEILKGELPLGDRVNMVYSGSLVTLRTCGGGCDRNRNADRNGENCQSHERYAGEKDTAAGEP